jgi:rubrerythrin
MTENKQFWKQVEKEQQALEIYREKAQKRRFQADPVRCSNCGTGVEPGELCPSCKKINRG